MLRHAQISLSSRYTVDRTCNELNITWRPIINQINKCHAWWSVNGIVNTLRAGKLTNRGSIAGRSIKFSSAPHRPYGICGTPTPVVWVPAPLSPRVE
jgi:hypothetical protein